MTITSERAKRIIGLLAKGELSHSDIARQEDCSREYVRQLSVKKTNSEMVFNSGLLRHLRGLRGFSIRELAKELRVAPSEVSRWEAGIHVPRLRRIRQIAVLFGVEPKKFVTEKAL